MRAAVWHAAGDVRVEERPRPLPGPGQALVAVGACGVCGTDVHEYASGPHFIQTGVPHPRTGAMAPLVIGHEFAGVVAAVGDGVETVATGDRVAVDVVDGCGECAGCAIGGRALCESLVFLGSHAPGGFADFVVAPAASLVPVADDVDLAEACLGDPVATAVHAVRRSGVRVGDRAWVSGCGPIGLSAVQVLRAAGATVDCAEPVGRRAELALELGAGRVLDQPEAESYDVAFETSGAAAGLERCVRAVRPRARVMCVSVWGSPPVVDLNAVVVRERELVGCLAYDHGEFAEAVRLIESGRVRVAPFITARIALEQLAERGLRRGTDGSDVQIKVVVELHDEKERGT